MKQTLKEEACHCVSGEIISYTCQQPGGLCSNKLNSLCSTVELLIKIISGYVPAWGATRNLKTSPFSALCGSMTVDKAIRQNI